MKCLRLPAIVFAMLSCIDGITLAETQAGLPPVQIPKVDSEPNTAITSESELQEPMCTTRVFSNLPAPLISTSCSERADQCGEFSTCLAEPNCGRTWVQFTPYAWATMVNGNATVNGVTAPVNLDLNDLWNLIENGEVRGAFMGHLEFGRDNWSMFFNGDIISVEPSEQVRRANLDIGFTMSLLEFGGSVDLFTAHENDPANSPLRAQMIGGLRYYATDTSAILSLPNVNPVVQVSQGEQWVDLFVGGRVVGALTPGVKAIVRGDIGGFGIGSCSDQAWNIVSMLSLDCPCGSDLVVGYRVLNIEQTLHGGTGSPQGFGLDALIHGPVIGITFQF